MVTNYPLSEFVDFIASTLEAEQILAFTPSTFAQNRLEDLLEKKRETMLDEVENRSLTNFFSLNI